MKGKADRLPARRPEAGDGTTKTSELWSAFPEDAMFAAAGQMDVAALYEAWGELMPKASKEAPTRNWSGRSGRCSARSMIKEVLPALGPDVGVCVTAPAKDAKEWCRAVLAAVRVAHGERRRADRRGGVLRRRVVGATVRRRAHNKQNPNRTLTLKTTHVAARARCAIWHGEGVFRLGMQPAFGLRRRLSGAELRRWRRSDAIRGRRTAPKGMPCAAARVSAKRHAHVP